MSLILNIDTALETASVSLAIKGEVIAVAQHEEQKDHAGWLQPAVEKILKESGYTLQDLLAVSVSIGPGSYTGLRIGLASAKGYCYALDIPLITIGTLEVIANSVKEKITDLVCPLIDARRMEVYAAVYEREIVEKIPPYAVDLKADSFNELLNFHRVLFCGNGSNKLKSLLSHPNASYTEAVNLIQSLSQLSYKCYTGNKFAVLAYTEPLYIKEFYTPARKN